MSEPTYEATRWAQQLADWEANEVAKFVARAPERAAQFATLGGFVSKPLRRMVRARTIKPITSVAGRTGFLRGQLLRDEGTGDYLVEAIGDAADGSSHLLASLAEANCLVVVPSEIAGVPAGELVDVAFLAQRG